jgi:hypothetical protein
MRNSLLTRAARASVAGTLLFSLGLAPALARVGAAHSSVAFVHGRPLGLRASNHFDFKRHAFERFDRHRFGFNRFRGNQLGLGLGFWGGQWGYSGDPPPSEPIIVGGGGPPVVINLDAGAGGGEIGGGYVGGCVIHKLMYDPAGKFVGERQIPAC